MKEYLPEEVLIEKFQNDEIGYMEFVLHHSPEYNEEYKEFCREKGLSLNDDTAKAFLDKLDKELEDALLSHDA